MAQMKRFFPPFLGTIIFALVAGCLVLYPLHSWKPFHIVGIAMVALYSCAWRFQQMAWPAESLLQLIDKNSSRLLTAWVAIYLLWCGVVLFANPYIFEVNHGDAVYYTQTMWNLVHGLRPESSFFTMNGMLQAGDDPRYLDTYGYVSIFTLHYNWLPMLLLTPLYALFPSPPMNVYALLVWCIVLGVPGVYWAARQAGASRPFAFFASLGYSLLPQVEIQLFFKGYVDALGIGLMPWMFGALFGKRWRLLLLFAFLVAAISFPYTQYVVMFGVVAMLFFRAYLPGLMVILIGAGMMKLDGWVFATAAMPYLAKGTVIPSFLKVYVLDRTIGSLIPAASVNTAYFIYLFQSVAFLPLLAVWKDQRWNMPLLGLIVLAAMAFGASLFRSYGWEFQRNAFFIVPVYMMGILAYLSLRKEDLARGTTFNAPAALLSVGVACAIFLGSPYINPPLASHFPWGVSGKVTKSENTRQWEKALKVFNSYVPKDASLAWWASPEIQGTLSNRQKVWYMEREPKGVRFYVFFGKPLNSAHEDLWVSKITALKASSGFKLVYEGNPGKRLVIFENLKAASIPRNEHLLGWGVLLGQGE